MLNNSFRTFFRLLSAIIIASGLLLSPGKALAQADDNILREPLTQQYYQRLLKETEYCEGDTVIFISLARQELYLMQGINVLKRYSISSSKYGIGCQDGSGQTPEGIHRIYRKIGHKTAVPYIYASHYNTGKKAKLTQQPKDSRHDYVTSRIMWLEGVEENFNCGGNVDSYHRDIYIHGTTEEGLIGATYSSGCIRMLNKDVIELYDLTPRLTYVVILNDIKSRL